MSQMDLTTMLVNPADVCVEYVPGCGEMNIFAGQNLHDLQFYSYYITVEYISRNATISYPFHEQLRFTSQI